jgi:hypothetical protein
MTMPSDSESTGGPSVGQSSSSGNSEVQILTAREVSVPIFPTAQQDMPDEVLRIRSDFLAGRQISREDMGELLRMSAESGGGGNGNCNIC